MSGVMPEWKKVESPMTAAAALRPSALLKPAIMPMLAPMQRQLSKATSGGSAPSV